MSERLTERDEYGNADIVGVDSSELQGSLEFNELNLVTNALNKLADYEEAEREGRMVVLPCNVGTPVFFIRILCEHADDFGYCNVDYWYAKRGFKTEDGCVNCPKMNLKQRLKETVFKLKLMDEKRAGHLHVSEIFFDKAEAERALAATEPKGDAT